MLTDKMS